MFQKLVRRAGVLVLPALALVTTPRLAAQAEVGISESAARQIQALLDEKESRTPAQRKIDSILLQAQRERHGGTLARGVTTLEPADVGADANGNVVVDIGAHQVTPALLNKLASMGAEVLHSSETYKTVRVKVSLDLIESIAELPAVRVVHTKDELSIQRQPSVESARVVDSGSDVKPPFSERARRVRDALVRVLPLVGSKQSEGDKTHQADLARSTYGYDGSGIRIGVISDSVDNLAISQANGNLGPVTVLAGQSGVPGTGEGTAMLEIVHDVAPGAQLFFATANPTQAQFAANITALAGAPNNCDIIVDDVFYFAEAVFEDGTVAQAVNTFTTGGGLYFSSAGNQGNVTSSTASAWEGDFVDGGASAAPLPLTGNVHQFPGGLAYDAVTGATTASIYLFWSDKYGASSNDYDLFRLNSTGTTVLSSSTTVQSGTQDPREAVSAPATGNRIVILKKTGAATRYLHLNAFGSVLATTSGGQTHGHSSAAGAFSVAATPAAAAIGAGNPSGPYPSPFTSANVIERFSSDGPRRMFYDAAGNPVNCCTAVTGGTTRQKPDITAADGVTTSVATTVGFSPFFGTSAAAPHAAAIAALLRSAGRTAAQTRTDLTSTAIDIMAAGVDSNSGAGIVMPKAALDVINPPKVAAAIYSSSTFTEPMGCGNANGSIDPGESASLVVTVKNDGGVSSDVTGTLTLATPVAGVTIQDGGPASFGTIGAGATGTNSGTPFRILVGPSVACGTALDFNLALTYTNGDAGASPSTQPFRVVVGQVDITSNLDTTAPPNTPRYTATTGTIAGNVRLNRNGTVGVCPNKACPGTFALAGSPRYDAYTFTNTSGSTACVTVTFTNGCNANYQILPSLYTPSFDPTNLCTNYLSDPGTSSVGNTQTFSGSVASGANFVVVVMETTAGAASGQMCPYTLGVATCQPVPADSTMPVVTSPTASTVTQTICQ